MSWIDLQELLLQQHPQTLAGSPELQHADLIEHSLCFAAGLQQRKIKSIALYLLDAGDLAVALLGAWRVGVQVVLPGDMQAQTQQRLAEQVDVFISDISQVHEFFAEPLSATVLALDEVLLILSTSGSTAQPKLIHKTLRQLNDELIVLEQVWGQSLHNAVFMGSVITQHIYGLLFRLLWPLCAGRYFIRQHLPFAEELQQHSMVYVAQQRPFVWVCSPALLKRMGSNLDWPQLAKVAQVFSSGGALPEKSGLDLAEKLKQSVTEVYGSSETGGIAWRQGGQQWHTFPQVCISQQENGALAVCSPWLAVETEYTSDAVELLSPQSFILKGRLDRVIKLEEKRISLPFLEDSLQQHPWVAEACLAVTQSGRASISALIVLNEQGLHHLRNSGRRQLTEQLRQHLSGYCEAMALPRRWRFIEQLPLNAQGKIIHSQVMDSLQQERPKLPIVKQVTGADFNWQLELKIPHDLAYFSGHFPSAPVLPGVVQVDWALHLAQQHMSLPSDFAGMEVLKFQQLVRPADEVSLSLRFEPEKNKLYFAFTMADTPCSSGRILLAGQHG